MSLLQERFEVVRLEAVTGHVEEACFELHTTHSPALRAATYRTLGKRYPKTAGSSSSRLDSLRHLDMG